MLEETAGGTARDVLLTKLAIRELIEAWVAWRDGGDWERLLSTWHADGRMTATWFQANAADFVERSRRATEAGLRVFHTLGGIVIDLNGARAVAQTKMQIIQRATVHDVLVDVSCRGRFMDALELRDGQWGIVERRLAYEWDRMDPVEPGTSLSLDPDLLTCFPDGYRHLAYLQTSAGFDVSKDLPGTRGPAMDALKDGLKQWLAGEPAAGLAPRGSQRE